jgi:hypothetical protein
LNASSRAGLSLTFSMPCWVHRANVMYEGMVVSPFIRDFRSHFPAKG